MPNQQVAKYNNGTIKRHLPACLMRFLGPAHEIRLPKTPSHVAFSTPWHDDSENFAELANAGQKK